MPGTTSSTLDDLQHENTALRNELDEYRQFTDAIRNGDLDALVVVGDIGRRHAHRDAREVSRFRSTRTRNTGSPVFKS